MNLFLKAPDTLFQQIEAIVTKRPNLLKADNWHELKSGREAFTDEQIHDPDTAHCLFGWVVALVPRAAEFEHCRQDVPEYVNQILTDNGRKPLPKMLAHSDEESMLKVIKMRADAERLSAMTKLRDFHIN